VGFEPTCPEEQRFLRAPRKPIPAPPRAAIVALGATYTAAA